MALQGQITFDNGIVLSSGYLIVTQVCLRYITNDNRADIEILIFKDLASYNVVDDGSFATYFAESILDDPGNTCLTQAYVYLKTLPQYSSLTDV